MVKKHVQCLAININSLLSSSRDLQTEKKCVKDWIPLWMCILSMCWLRLPTAYQPWGERQLTDTNHYGKLGSSIPEAENQLVVGWDVREGQLPAQSSRTSLAETLWSLYKWLFCFYYVKKNSNPTIEVTRECQNCCCLLPWRHSLKLCSKQPATSSWKVF